AGARRAADRAARGDRAALVRGATVQRHRRHAGVLPGRGAGARAPRLRQPAQDPGQRRAKRPRRRACGGGPVMDCADVEKALLDGRKPAGPELHAHLPGGDSCRFLCEDGGPVARALAGSAPPDRTDLAALEQRLADDVAADRGIVGALRALPRPARFGLVAVLIGLEVLFFYGLMRRGDMDVYPAA